MDLQSLSSHCNESQQQQIVVYCGCFFAAGASMIILRMLCKAKYAKVLIDDYLAIASVVRPDQLHCVASAEMANQC